MAKPGPQVGEDGIDDKDAKHLLDSIGKIVHEEIVKNDADAKKYIEELKGYLYKANGYSLETASTNKTCKLVEQYYERLNGERYPCTELSGKDVKRFSEVHGGECDKKKIRDNEDDMVGACAPYRRLYLCDYNLEKMGTKKIDNTHDLLAEVCMAAKYEGGLIKEHYTKYKETNEGTASELCTMLARSFADIGDIIRGRDLYLGNPEEIKQRKQLDENLKTIFGKIYEKLKEHKKLKDEAKKRYKDEPDKNYYKLREDWWTANRGTVWKALTCKAEQNDKYFRKTACGEGTTSTQGYCRCDGDQPGKDMVNVDPPTYFDYVPQYLRWFEEWAEDFCRKKKKKVQNLEQQCRGIDKSGNDKYCSGNGYDCTKTIYKKGRIVEGYECTSCSGLCRMYEKWIDNQKKEFLKQRNKYEKEIQKYTKEESRGDGRGRKKRSSSSSSSDDNGYEKKFYNKLKDDSNYSDVNNFLEILSKEEVCKKITDEKEKINFKTADISLNKNINSQGTFYHSQYCKPCPDCGVKRDGKDWKEKKDGRCDGKKRFNITPGAPFNDIPVLSFGDKGNEIKQKIDKFCQTQNGNSGKASSSGSGDCGGTNNSDSSLCEKWKCYEAKYVQKDENAKEEDDEDDGEYDKDYENMKSAGGLCILENKNKSKGSDANSQNEPEQFQKTFNEFFYFWIGRFLNDSIEWREKLDKCLQNDKKTCIRKCNDNCKCYKKWVKQKKDEWDKIKEQFRKQDDIKKETGVDPIVTLEGVLEYEYFPLIQEAYGNAKELEGITKTLHSKENQQTAATDNQKKTILDYLLEHEGEDADKCVNNNPPENCKPKERKPPSQRPQPVGPPGRSENTDDIIPKHVDVQDEEDDDDEDEDSGGKVEEEAAADSATTKQGEDTDKKGEVEPQTPATQDTVDVCKIVGDALKLDTLTKACNLKYGPGGKEKFPNWKCVTPSGGDNNTREGSDSSHPSRKRRASSDESAPSSGKSGGSDSSSSGAICVPPRRRKLYVGGLTKWADNSGNTQAVSGEAQVGEASQGGGKAPQSEKSPQDSPSATASSQAQSDPLLLTAFVESAAVETFFLWHKYKVDKEREEKERKEARGIVPVTLSKPEELDKKLKKGEIPDDFLRQMFYTLGDYRDIVVRGGHKDGSGKEIVVHTSGNKEEKQKMQEIQQKITDMLNKTNSVSTPPGTPKTDSVEQRKEWWNNNAKDIWKGMVCALTYEHNGAKGTSNALQQNEEVKEAFFGKDNNTGKPGTTGTSNGTQNGTYKTQYDYKTVTLKDEQSGGDPTLNNPKLSDFVKIPPFFRWLHEWGSDFCDKRARMLELIYKECKVENDRKNIETPKCSCYGEDCEHQLDADPTNVSDLKCPGCGRHCRKYKQWIEKKKTEYEKQQNAYTGQKAKCQTQSNCDQSNKGGGNGFCKTLEREAAAFLNNLGPCKKNSGEANIDFGDKTKTFVPAKNCKPCSEFKTNCKNGQCNGEEIKNCNGGKITAQNMKDMEKNTEINMLMSDNGENAKQFPSELNKPCKDVDIFEGIKENKWECRKVCGYVVCKPVNVNGQNDATYIIQIRALFKRWLEYFLEDYWKIKHKISHCIKNDKEYPCIRGCEQKCECVSKWIDQKKIEWTNIKERILEQYKNKDEDVYPVTSFLETFIPQIAVANVKNEVIKLSQFDNFCSCSANAHKQKDSNQDAIECMIKKLEEKAKTCLEQHSAETCTQTTLENPSTPLDEEDLTLEEDEQNTLVKEKVGNKAPAFCKIEEKKEEKVEKCEEAQTAPEAPEPAPAGGSDETDKEKPETKDIEAPPSTPSSPRPRKPRTPQPDLSPLKTALMSSTIMWSIGIGFAAFTYFYLKVLNIYMYIYVDVYVFVECVWMYIYM